jgi:hypothetical protein
MRALRQAKSRTLSTKLKQSPLPVHVLSQPFESPPPSRWRTNLLGHPHHQKNHLSHKPPRPPQSAVPFVHLQGPPNVLAMITKPTRRTSILIWTTGRRSVPKHKQMKCSSVERGSVTESLPDLLGILVLVRIFLIWGLSCTSISTDSAMYETCTLIVRSPDRVCYACGEQICE